MKNLEKFKNESLEMNELINIKGGDLMGGDGSGSCLDWEDSTMNDGSCDVRLHSYNDNGTYNGYEDFPTDL